MAEINVAQLPVTPSAEFTSNDYFLIVNDGKAQQLGRGVLQQWIQNTMRGEKGDQGVAGTNGADGKNGINGVSAQHSWNGTTLTITSASGTSSADLKGQDGVNGSDGSNGWSPTLAVVEDGVRRVHQVTGWVGGTGVTPEIGQYLSHSGLVSDINQATDVRGSQGVQGIQGEKGEKGEKGEDGTDGVDGKSITTLTYNPDNSINIVYSDSTEVDSDTPYKLTGWASYKDSVYTQTDPLIIPISGDVVLPNDATTNVVNYPYGVDSFYNATNQKYLLQDELGYYSVRIKFKVLASDTPDFLNVTFSKDTTDTPYSEDFPLRGDDKIQEINVSTVIYGDSTLASNGMTIRLKTNTRAVSIYGIESIVAKLI